MRRVLAAIALLAIAPIVPAPAQPASVQQQFDAASTALETANWEEALRLFEALEMRVRNPRTLAVVRVRKASALLRLGRRDQAAEALRLGLAELPAGDDSLHEDRFLGLLTLGELAEQSLDYREAQRRYREAAAVPVPARLRLAVYRGLVQTGMFDDAPAALAYVDEALALARDAASGAQHQGVLRTLKGRVLLNMGRHREARAELRTAMERLGGLTLRVNLADIVARSDLAIAAVLAGDPDDARRYLAYTGAGHHETRFSPSTGGMEPPRCGDDLLPSDVAVIEFSIRDDGTVGHATPVYSSRSGAGVLLFARAVLGWGWNPESFAEIDPVFRLAMRVEIRCTNQYADADDPPVDHSTEGTRWYRALGLVPNPRERTGPLPSPAALRAELARREAASGPDSATLLAPLIELGRHPALGSAEAASALRRALPIAAAAGAPATVVATLSIGLAYAGRGDDRSQHRPPDFSEALAHPAVRADPRATAAVQAARARALYHAGEDDQAAVLADEILTGAGLPPDDPVSILLLQVKAAVAAAAGDRTAARAAHEAMGAAAEPCAVSPRHRRSTSSGRDFPDDALRWGFEGWALIEAAVDGDGALSGPRTILAYPPLVFGESAERIVARSRFAPTYLPDERRCQPMRQQVTFRVADRR